MKKVQIAFLDEEGFMENLANYLCRKVRVGIETRLFTSFEMLKKHVSKGETQVLIVDEMLEGQVHALKTYVPQIMLLSEGNMVHEGREFTVLFKYQSAQEIIGEILEQVAEDERIPFEKSHVPKGTMECIGVYAPFGGGGVSEYAFALGKKLSKTKKTLYVNLEEFHGMAEKYTLRRKREECGYRGMSEVIFYLKQRKEKLALKLETLIHVVDHLDCIPAVEDYRDLHNMSAEDVKQFLEVLSEQTMYEVVVFDIGYLEESTLFLMEQCKRLYMPACTTDTAKCKTQAFEQLLLRNNRQNLWEKFERIS